MRYFRLSVSGGLGLLGLIAAGCNSEGGSTVTQRPIDATEATTATNERVDVVLTGLADTTDQMKSTGETSAAGDGLSVIFSGDPCNTTTNSPADSVPEETTNALGDAIKKVRDEAKTHVFRQDLVESDDGNRVVYKMIPAEVCDSNTECIDKLTANPVRFAVTANSDDTLNVALLVGQDQHNPANAVLGENKLSVRGDLTESLDSLRLFMSTTEQADLPDKLAGSVEWSIEKRAAGEFVITSALLSRFELLTGQTKGKPVSVSVQPTSPTSQITINSNTNSITFSENIGTVDVTAAGSAVCGDLQCGAPEEAGTFGLHVAGLTGQFATSAGATEVTFSDLGLGADTSYLSLNGQKLTQVDLNPSSGRKFSMNFKKTDAGTLVTFEPELDLTVAMAMSNLSETMRVDMPEWLSNEVLDVTLGGAPKPSVLIPAKVCDASGNVTTKDQIEVIAGKLSLDATSIAAPVEVMAGMCLVPVENTENLTHPMTLVTSGICQ
jgi:hypothetical protein